MKILLQCLVGLAISSGIGFAAYKHKSLTKNGMLGAILTGTAIFGLGGWIWGALLITFFILSSLLSKYQADAKSAMAEKFAKGACRDIGQVLANGGAGAFFATLFPLLQAPVIFFAFLGAMATVNADTWATELGVLSKKAPRLITTGKKVSPGTSGGITLLGTLATFSGGLAIGLAGLLFMSIDGNYGGTGTALVKNLWPVLLIAATLGGLAGSLFDSLLGATIQAIYYSDARRKETEKVIDPNGIPNRHIRGWTWLNNDWVNFISSLVGAGVSALVWTLFTI